MVEVFRCDLAAVTGIRTSISSPPRRVRSSSAARQTAAVIWRDTPAPATSAAPAKAAGPAAAQSASN